MPTTVEPGGERRLRRLDQLPEQPQSVLVADDEEEVAAGIATTLRGFGHHIIGPVSEGQQAIDLCGAVLPDIAVLDVQMPRIDGIAAARTVYCDYGVPVVVVSAHADPEYVDGAIEAGVFAYLLKPVSAEQLRVAIRVAWARHRAFCATQLQIEALQNRLEDRKIIEQAKWLLVKHKQVEEPEAMRLLQRKARDNRRPLVEIARSLVEHDEMFREQ